MSLQELKIKKLQEKLKAAAEFMDANKAKENILTTESGLQYEILVAGSGTMPKSHQKVTVHYEGRLVNGKVFDSSYQRNKTATFPLGNVIQGWSEALQLMPLHAKYRLFIPPYLGYGEQGAGAIGANEVLIFEVELLGIS
jgi:FKBP-type peptidyl-prolyl cis-trans isomerase